MPPSLKANLQKRLDGARRVAVLSAGSDLRGDDAAGLLAADHLARLFKPHKGTGSSPEMPQLQGVWRNRPRLRSELSQRSHKRGRSCHTCLPVRESPVTEALPLPDCSKEAPVPEPPVVRVFQGHTAPENLTGEIREFHPTHLIVLDAADMGLPPGRVAILDPDAPVAGLSASTHTLPLKLTIEYLRRATSCQVLVIGIQPASRRFGHPVSKSVDKAARRAAALIASALHGQ